MKRSEQKVEDTWNLQDIYENEQFVLDEMEECKKLTEELKGYSGHLTSGKILFEMLEKYERIQYLAGRLVVYSNQSAHQDMANAKYQKMCGDVDTLDILISEGCSFIEPEILAIQDMDAFMEECQDLNKYKRFIESITYKKEHILDTKMEALLARAQDLANASQIFDLFTEADFKFNNFKDSKGNEHELTHGNYIRYLTMKDRSIRENAFKCEWGEYKKYNNTLGAILNANLKEANFFSKERNFKNTMEAQLFDNEIPVQVYSNLLETIHKHLPALHKYVGLRKKILGLDELHMYDIYLPLTTLPERRYSFDQAKEMVLNGLSVLGDDYLDLLKEGFDHRWIDVYENEGKATGAYSWGCYGTHPYVLLNYTETLDEVFTVAHEMGHAIHTYHSNKYQNLLNSSYRIFVAEVASTCNESILIHDLMNKCEDKEEKKYLINYFLDQFKGTMFRQAQFAEFEMLAHQMIENGETVTAEALNEIYLDLNQKYYGPHIVNDEEIKYEWSKISHFYTPFYVYQYATGFAAAIAISAKILKGEEGILEKYKQFLSGGCSMSPIDLLKICDVDMTSTKPIDEALNVFEEYIEEFEKLL